MSTPLRIDSDGREVEREMRENRRREKVVSVGLTAMGMIVWFG